MIKRICKECGKEFLIKSSQLKYGWGKYCSRECTHKSQITGKFYNCFICKKEIYKSPAQEKHSKSHKFFCSKSCQIIWRNSYFSGNKHANWNGGSATYRDKLKKSSKNKACIICGVNNINILTAHHIDHNRKNNKLSNLTWLCLNCHHLVHHNKDLDLRVKMDQISS